MAIFRKGAASLTTLLIFAFGCGPVVPISDQGTASVVHDGKDPLAAAMDSANLQRFEATIDPRTKTVDVQRVGFQTKTTNIYVASLNAKWNAPVSSFDLVVWNYNPSPLPNVTGVVLSTTPTAPTVSLIGTSGTTSDGYPYYDYG
ncbi:MAG: hypothetical protein H7338_14170, partial [Candidatus Sericytochromatia bacterium]|nr:hypothetical protein [Candidatus Sericytochromatia bacterium]